MHNKATLGLDMNTMYQKITFINYNKFSYYPHICLSKERLRELSMNLNISVPWILVNI